MDDVNAGVKGAPTEDAPEEISDTDIIRRAKDCYLVGMAASSTWRHEALEDLEFLAGRQWDPALKGQRDAERRPALTVNRLPQFVRQVTNEQRQSKPSITVSPIDSSGDIRTAEVLQGCIRNVEYSSNADAAYASGGQSAAITGLGFWDVCAEFEDERSFEQRLTIERIPNSLMVVMDPGARELAGDDARWVIKSSDISLAEWKSRWPDREPPLGTVWSGGEGNSPPDWVGKDGVRLHEYRWIQEDEDVLVDVPPGVFEDVPEGGPMLVSELEPEVAKALLSSGAPSRPTTRRRALWARIAGDEVVERGELAGRYLQLVRVVGTELEIDGEVIYEGVVRHARDTQRMLNYFVSAEAEAIGLAPKAPFIAAEGQIENHAEDWKNANQRPLSVLVYKPTAIDGHPVPPPQRVMAEANVSAITNARMQAADDLKAVTGIYDGQLGARSNETSGRAILARQSQGQTANFHFQDNLAMAIRYTGRILIDLIPRIYSGPRVLRILGEDGRQEMVPVNGAPVNDGRPVVDLNAGRYDVAVSMGPSYQSRRQEAAAQMLELMRINPAVSQAAGDLLVESMDLPNGKAIAERIRKALPPEIRPPDEKQPPPQVLAMRLQHQDRLVERLTQQLNAVSEDLAKALDGTASKERLEMLKARVQIALKLADIESREGLEMLRLEHAAIGRQMAATDTPVMGATQQGGATYAG